MNTLWIYRINVICPIYRKDVLNALWSIIGPTGDFEAESFGVDLSPNGEFPSTHCGISTCATEEMRILIKEIFSSELSDTYISVESYLQNNWTYFLSLNNLILIPKEVS